MQFHGTPASLAQESGSSGAWFHFWSSGITVLWHCFWGNQACWVVRSVTYWAVGAGSPAYTGAPVSLAFQGESSRSCGGERVELWVPECAGKQGILPSEHWVMESGAEQQLQGQGIWSVELWVLLPIFPHVVICFSICRFREDFASCWLWDPPSTFWGPLIFLF
jgi:hypothetical protein